MKGTTSTRIAENCRGIKLNKTPLLTAKSRSAENVTAANAFCDVCVQMMGAGGAMRRWNDAETADSIKSQMAFDVKGRKQFYFVYQILFYKKFW